MSLNIVCVQVENYAKRGADYVNILHDMCTRNLAEGYRGTFTCFTDDFTGLDPAIVARPPPHQGLKGWFNKIALFKPGLFSPDDRILYFDLDTLITGRLDEIASYDGEFAILADFFRPTHGPFSGLQSGVMGWRGGFGAHIWQAFVRAGLPELDGGDQEFIRLAHKDPDLWQPMFPGLFVSYKATGGAIPERASVVCFHGEPRPHEVTKGWVPNVWRVGGYSRADLDVICNTRLEELLSNIESACARDLPWVDFVPDHERHVCIVGGGPSLADNLDVIRMMRGFGHAIWALNGAGDWLADRGVFPDAVVLLDARPSTASFVKHPFRIAQYYVASQCHPSVFEALEGHRVKVFHSNTTYATDLLMRLKIDKPTHLFGGGSTVGLTALALARKQGFKGFHLYGMDSSYRGSEGHAYPQAINDGDRVLDTVCGDRTFKAAPWMITQAREFPAIAQELADDDCIIEVAGDGLLAAVAREMMKPPPMSEDGRFKEVDGVWWPAGDSAGSRAITRDVERDVGHALRHCPRRRLVIQAGGNVGLYPALLAEHFASVVTFEPDPDNWECLRTNLGNRDLANIAAYNAALGDSNRPVSVSQFPDNCGASEVSGDGLIPSVRIDDLEVGECDLIWLDVEGSEMRALRGARATIERHHPTIIFEFGATQARLGMEVEEILGWLRERGYREMAKCGRDIVMTYDAASTEQLSPADMAIV